MVVLAASTLVFTVLAVLVLRWARADLAEHTWLSSRSLLASWLLYVSHADTVASAAWMQLLHVDVPRTPALIVGGAIGVAGFTLFLAGTIVLVRFGDLDGPRSRRLVTSGPYRLTRHPQHVGWGLLLAGCAIGGRSLVALALVALFAAFVSRYARHEEQHLGRQFGDAYEAYARATPVTLTLRPARHASLSRCNDAA